MGDEPETLGIVQAARRPSDTISARAAGNACAAGTDIRADAIPCFRSMNAGRPTQRE